MATVQHPAFSDDSRQVPDADLASWLEQGWLEAQPFANGGLLPAGPSVIRNDSGAPEPVAEPKRDKK